MTLVFASSNENKITEIRSMLPDDITILGLSDIGCTEDIPETAQTIEGNAILKANYVTAKFGSDCFADDTGLEVEALDGAPGVHSARFAGEEKSPEKNMSKLLEELHNHSNRSARFVTVIALNINNEQHLFTGIINGTITNEPRGNGGFGYDPVFIPNGYDKTFAELSMVEKSRISHRGIATAKLIDFIKHL